MTDEEDKNSDFKKTFLQPLGGEEGKNLDPLERKEERKKEKEDAFNVQHRETDATFKSQHNVRATVDLQFSHAI